MLQVADKTGTKGSPSLFVAAKTVRQAACRAAASSMTSQVERCCNPVWDEMLTLSYHESSMAKVIVYPPWPLHAAHPFHRVCGFCQNLVGLVLLSVLVPSA